MSIIKKRPVRIVGDLKSRVNILAHRVALQQESLLRDHLTARLQVAAEGGATAQELHTILDRFEAAQNDRS